MTIQNLFRRKQTEQKTTLKRNTHAAKSGKRKRRRRPLILRILSKIGSVLLISVLSFTLLFLVTGVICGAVATAYVVNYMETTTSVSIQELTLSYSTNIFELDANGEPVNVYHVNNDVQRMPISIDQVKSYTRDAFVFGEDERFYQHEGVDYQRTAFVIAKLIISFWNADQGGSTITQQLVKNLTGDDEVSPQRKMREIYRALQMEKSYSKDEILETYMNYIGFGGAASGIEMAAKKYFDKDVSELSIAESACLAAIPQSPEVNNPFAGYYEKAYNEVTGTYYVTDNFVNTGKEINRKRMEYILGQMYNNGAITYDEYQTALAEKLIFTDSEEYLALHPVDDKPAQTEQNQNEGTSWVVDEALREFADYLIEERGITRQRAMTLINTGGYQIYTTVNREMQDYVEAKFQSMDNLLKGMTTNKATTIYRDLDGDGVYSDEENLTLQSGFTAIDYSGNVLCTVGGIGKKQGSLGTSFASTEPQQPGSAIKPVSTYGYALENNLISWGTKVLDYPPLQRNGKLWPTNYSESSNVVKYSNTKINVYKALEQSYNTIPAVLAKTYGVRNVFDFSTEVLGLNLSEKYDVDYAPLSVGALGLGITVKDLVNAYMVYGNGGYFSNAHIISRVETGDGVLVYAGGDDYQAVIDPETSYVMNKLLQNVVENGTGKKGRIYVNGKAVPLAGKTGTTSDWCDLMFVGLNPDFVSGVWIGYKENKEIKGHRYLASSAIWKNIIGEWIQTHYTGNDFPTCDSVIKGNICAATGKIAVDTCGKGVVGYWKSSNAPYCDNQELGLRGVGG